MQYENNSINHFSAHFSGLGVVVLLAYILSSFSPAEQGSVTLEVEVTGDTTICRGDTVVLQATVVGDNGPFSYAWYDSEDFDGVPLGTEAQLSVNPDTTTTYFVNVTSSGDAGIGTATITVQPGPTIKLVNLKCLPGPDPKSYSIQFRAVTDTILLFPGNLTFKKSGPFDYLIQGVPSGDTVKIRAVLFDNGCTYEAVYTHVCQPCLEQFGVLETALTTSDTTVCEGQTLQLGVAPSGNVPPYIFEWFDNPGFLGDPIGTDSVLSTSVTENTTYYVRTTAICDQKLDSVQISVNPLPELEVLQSTCETDELTYCTTVRTNGDIVSTIPSNFEIIGINDSVFSICGIPIGDQVIIRSTFEQTGCFREIPVRLEICCTEDLIVDIVQGDTTLCSGSSINLEASADGSTEPYTYAWYTSADFSQPPIGNQPEIEVMPDLGTTYFMRVTSPCDEAIDSVVIDVLPAPTIEVLDTTCIDDDQAFCIQFQTSGTELTLSPATFVLSEIGPGTFEICDIANDSSVVVTAEGPEGCSSMVLLTGSCEKPPVCEDSLRIDILEEDLEVCVGDCLTLTTETVGNQPPFSYAWFDNSSLTGPPLGVASEIEVCPTDTSWYYVVVNDESDCTEPAIDSVLIFTKPSPTLTIDTSVCEGATYCVTIRTDATSITSEPEGFNISEVATGVFEVCAIPQGTSITIVVEQENGCQSSVQTSDPCPPPCTESIAVTLLSTSNEICEGDCVTLRASADGPQLPLLYQWFESNLGGTPISTDSLLEVCPLENTWYYVIVDDVETECTTTPGIDSILISVNPRPLLQLDTTICADQTFCATILTDQESISTAPATYPITKIEDGKFEVCEIPTNETVTVFAQTEAACQRTIEVSGNCCPDQMISIMDESELPDCLEELDPDNLPSVFLQAGIEDGADPVSITWYDDPTFPEPALATGPDFVFEIAATTTFYAVATDANNCEDIDSLTVSLNIVPDLQIGTFACAADANSFSVMGTTNADSIEVTAGVLALDAAGSFEITDVPSDAILEITAIDATNQCSTQEIVDPMEECCFPKEGNEINVSANRDCIVRGDTTQLKVENCVDCTYEWTPTTGLENPSISNPIVQPQNTTIYTVNIFDRNGCLLDTRDLEIIVFECGPENIFLPNVFTPNGDGNNDVLVLQIINVSQVKLLIFNRFGEEVLNFEWELPPGAPADSAEDGTKPRKLEVWDGTFKDKELRPDVFGYYLEATCVNAGEPIVWTSQGNITLLR